MQNIRLNKSKIIKYTCFITNVTTLVAKTWKWEDYVKTKTKTILSNGKKSETFRKLYFWRTQSTGINDIHM